ncbi:ubiquitin carboxyl-terminal hydrolase 30-like [Lytechinus variegatus]|uniref:ubiquitin carboxyl-terminal hydrolase 30-like n=1 Tax=Lytechinus variegatus TaxID=7654 RepID=UPI001BB27875|nr:ubiquitin carboxyl-terminal hydrolase 30-like [Lytechinus variegatus]
MKGFHIQSENLVPIIGLGVTAAVALLYILWSPGPSNSKRTGRKRKVAGLENLGNTCYLNTILQSLAACPAFLAWLNRALRRGCFKGRGNELAYRLSRTLEGVNDYSSSTVYSPHEVLYSLYNRNWRPGQEQQDAHELFQFLLSELSEDREQPTSPLPLSEAPKLVKHVPNGRVNHSGLRSSIKANLPRVTIRDVDSPFRGLLAHHLSCTICGHKNPVTYTSFDCLSLPIPTLSLLRTLSLDCILERFTHTELVHDVECVECSKTSTSPQEDGGRVGGGDGARKVQGDGDRQSGSQVSAESSPGTSPQARSRKKCKRVFQKQMTISKLPQCLCIHIQRVGWQTDGLPFRREEHIMFPEVLDMSRYRLASVNATCNNGSIGVTKSLRLVQQTALANNQKTITTKKSGSSSMNHSFIGDRFLSPSRPASLRLVGGGWRPTEQEEEEEEEKEDKEEERTQNLENTTLEDDKDSYLDVSNYSSRPMESKYRLASAVVHVGNAFSGHFLTYRRGPSKPNEPLNSHWLCVSDESVYTAQLSDVLSQKAYMLYYQRECQ